MNDSNHCTVLQIAVTIARIGIWFRIWPRNASLFILAIFGDDDVVVVVCCQQTTSTILHRLYWEQCETPRLLICLARTQTVAGECTHLPKSVSWSVGRSVPSTKTTLCTTFVRWFLLALALGFVRFWSKHLGNVYVLLMQRIMHDASCILEPGQSVSQATNFANQRTQLVITEQS